MNTPIEIKDGEHRDIEIDGSTMRICGPAHVSGNVVYFPSQDIFMRLDQWRPFMGALPAAMRSQPTNNPPAE